MFVDESHRLLIPNVQRTILSFSSAAERAEPEAAVGQERAQAQLVGQGQRPVIVVLGAGHLSLHCRCCRPADSPPR